MPAPGSRTKSDERRQVALKAAVACFAHKGLYGTTTTEIATLAGISQPYLYRLFASKEVLFADAVRYVSELLSESLATHVTPDASSQTSALSAARMAYSMLIRDQNVMRFLMQANCAASEQVIREAVIECYATQARHVSDLFEGDADAVRRWFGAGMLENVTTVLGLAEVDEPWARILDGR